MSLTQNISNVITIRVKGENLNLYKDLKFYLRQYDCEFEFSGVVSSASNEVMAVYIPKDVALTFKYAYAEWQVAMTQKSNNLVRKSKAQSIKIEKLLWREGYGD